MAPLAKEEKRRFPRIKIAAALRYQIMGSPASNNTLSEDISVGGIGFINDKYIAPSSKVILGINILSKAINTTGRIVWAMSLPHSDRYRLGAEFMEFGASEKRWLSDYIDLQTTKA